MEPKLTVLRVDVSKHTGEVMLLEETACGFRPVIGWPDISGLRDFAETLLGICSHINDNNGNGTVTPGIEV